MGFFSADNMPADKKSRLDEEVQFRILSSGNPLPTDASGKFMLRAAQHKLVTALYNFDEATLIDKGQMPDADIVRIIRCTDKVPDEVLEMVADHYGEEIGQLARKNQPKFDHWPSLSDVGIMCMSALVMRKKMKEFLASRKPGRKNTPQTF